MGILLEDDAADWVYRGEGRANLVVHYTGTSPAFIGKVMRIRKVSRNHLLTHVENPKVLTEEEKIVWQDDEELLSSPNQEILEQRYMEHVIGPLLGPNDVHIGTHVLVSREFLQTVEKNMYMHRPAWRVDDSKVDIEHQHALLMPDHCLFCNSGIKDKPCVSVEIKPKCGFLPTSRFISDYTSIKKAVPRFTMHQALKFHKKEISEVSLYNPTDLFSGCRARIHKAVKDLCANPQNNLRVFLKGSIVFGCLGGGTEHSSIPTLENALEGIIDTTYGSRTSSLIQLISDAIFRSCILDRLLGVQKLDTLDIEGAIHAYHNIVSKPCRACNEPEKAHMVRDYVLLHSVPLEESARIVRNFLVSTTAKDCSVMISFMPAEDEDVAASYTDIVCLPSTGQKFYYKANFIDLDMKPLDKMNHYYKLDKQIVNFYKNLNRVDMRELPQRSEK